MWGKLSATAGWFGSVIAKHVFANHSSTLSDMAEGSTRPLGRAAAYSTGRLCDSFDSSVDKVLRVGAPACSRFSETLRVTGQIAIGVAGTIALSQYCIATSQDGDVIDRLAHITAKAALTTLMCVMAVRTVRTMNLRSSAMPRAASAPNISVSIDPLSADEIQEQLFKAAYLGDCEQIAQLQRQGVPLELQDDLGRSAVHYSAIGLQRQALEQLWLLGCNLHLADNKGNLPLYYIKIEEP